MRKLLILLVVLSIFLFGCDSDLPPEPNAPGLAGNYYLAMYDWATEPVAFFLQEDRLECSGDDKISLRYIADDEFVYRFMYVWVESDQEWIPLPFEGTQVGDSNWLRGSSRRTIDAPCDEFREIVADMNDEVFAVAYTCRRSGSGWDCHDRKWQMQIASVKEALCPDTVLELNVPVLFEKYGESYIVEVVGGNDGLSRPDYLPVLEVNRDRVTIEQGLNYSVAGVNFYVQDVFVSDVPFITASAVIIVDGLNIWLDFGQRYAIRVDGIEYEFEIFDVEEVIPSESIVSPPNAVISVNGIRRTVHEGNTYYFGNLNIEVLDLFVSPRPSIQVAANVRTRVGDACIAPVPCDGYFIDGECIILPDDPDAPGGSNFSIRLDVLEDMPLQYGDSFTLTWSSRNTVRCAAFGSPVPMVNGTLFSNIYPLPPNGSVELVATNYPYGYVPSLVIGMQCFDSQGNSEVQRTVVRVNENVCESIILDLNQPKILNGNVFEVVGGNSGTCESWTPGYGLLEIYVPEDGGGVDEWVHEGDNFSFQGRDIYVESIFITDIPAFDGSIQFTVNDETVHLSLGQFIEAQGLRFSVIDLQPSVCQEHIENPTAVLDVNGMRRTVRPDNYYTMGGVIIGVQNVFVSTIPSLSVSVELFGVTENESCLVETP